MENTSSTVHVNKFTQFKTSWILTTSRTLVLYGSFIIIILESLTQPSSLLQSTYHLNFFYPMFSPLTCIYVCVCVCVVIWAWKIRIGRRPRSNLVTCIPIETSIRFGNVKGCGVGITFAPFPPFLIINCYYRQRTPEFLERVSCWKMIVTLRFRSEFNYDFCGEL